MTEEDKSFAEFLEIVSKLEPKARQDVIDVAVFFSWKHTRATRPPWRRVMRGAGLYFAAELEKLLRRGKGRE